MKLSSLPAIMIMLFCVVVLTGTQIHGLQDKPVEDRVTKLEIQLSDLNSRILQLEQKLSANITNQSPANSSVPVGKEAWRKLKRRMNKSQVRTILGEPIEIEVSPYNEHWKYRDFSQVEFNEDGYVEGWREP